METLTIPKTLIKHDDLVIIPRKEYKKFLYILKIIDKDQLWFWTKEWQKKEKEATRDIKLGNVGESYRTKKELKAALDELKK
ncbi:AbrB/MazE/SpoVT family DNA-binding domain-containing protein [Patescibacteria group bacterium]|nr:AbrB/MazE/SpoVT family DNA-binding domain-containing protein [Candidatus Falkowbacteria bacterium]MBU3906256.1 AbrB/MazE/SpoVT family DNA-binding domain-containing protein [Patescibacteria group bacterium]MCG2697888.1 AbrB/MazE/SpoVT family DNA-binding domain-containing protein [Candidatus Parcubacteria bacterium]MBU4015707.1 AbrB/MazE/SpoVT family DNA-binding domain-containing protein [Patescibacteria group bacterium]MBU4026885.1 AbrB/MazE/SpoVT family DNA-binding domain-containing protein 